LRRPLRSCRTRPSPSQRPRVRGGCRRRRH
jgi:hypothetical protein